MFLNLWEYFFFLDYDVRGAWVPQSAQCLVFCSGHGPGILGWSSASGSLLRGQPASPPLSAALPTCALSLSLSDK